MKKINRASKGSKTRPPPTPDQLLRHVLDIVMEGDDPGVASRVVAAARSAGVGPSDEEMTAWVERFERSRATPYDSLETAIRTIDDACDLVDALVAAASRDGVAPPADQPWMEGFNWSSTEPDVRWNFLRVAIEDAANTSLFTNDDRPEHASLGAYLDVVLPTLVPATIDRLEWWFARARAVSSDRDTDLDFGMDARAIADEWVGEASESDLPTLLRLAVLLQRPVWGASSAADGTLQMVYEQIREALPPPRRGKRKLKVRARGAGRNDSPE